MEEFRAGCGELGLRLSMAEATAVFGLCDARVDGLLTYYGAARCTFYCIRLSEHLAIEKMQK